MQAKVSLIAPYYREIFEGVCPGWKKILFSDTLKPILNGCFRKLDKYLYEKGVTELHINKNGLGAYIRPKPQYIFEAFKYFDPNNMVGIIIGQDPYTKPEEAQGLCFSTPKRVKTPKSLEVIYKCLNKYDLLDDGIPNNGELISWAKQGILLLNRYLTRSPNIKQNDKGEIWIDGNGDSDTKFLHKFWSDFTNELLKYISNKFYNPIKSTENPRMIINHKNHYLAVMMWGKIAQELSVFINRNPEYCKVETFDWCHPVSTTVPESNENHFVNCNHFVKLNEALISRGYKKINWDPRYQADDSLLNQFYYLTNDEAFERVNRIINENLPDIVYVDGTSNPLNQKIGKFLSEKNEKEKREDKKGNEKEEKGEEKKINEDVNNDEKITEAPKFTRKISNKLLVNPIVVSVDGACLDNGKKNAKASYSAHFPKIFNGKNNGILDENQNLNIYGLVPKNLVILDEVNWILKEQDQESEKSTNGRGELLGLVHAFIKIIKRYEETKIKRPIYVIEDATYGLHMINNRLWKYLLNNQYESIKTNRDLVYTIKTLLFKLAETVPNFDNPELNATINSGEKLTPQIIWDILIQPNGKTFETEYKEQELNWGGLTMLHQNSHLNPAEKEIVRKKGGVDLEKNICNEVADSLCHIALKEAKDYDPITKIN